MSRLYDTITENKNFMRDLKHVQPQVDKEETLLEWIMVALAVAVLIAASLNLRFEWMT